MRRFRNRRRYRSGGERRLPPWVIPLICAAGALLITIIIGNFLKLWLDGEEYRRLREGTDKPQKKDEQLYRANAPDVQAFAYEIGDPLLDVLELPAVSFSANTPDGRATYTSEVTAYFGISSVSDAPLDESMSDLLGAASYVSCVFHPQAFGEVDEDLTYAKTSVDRAVVRELIEEGMREILLCGIPFETASTDEIVAYLKALKGVMGKRPLGVAVPLSVAQRADAWELIGALGKVCDFFAIDMRGTDAPLADANFYLLQYDMRMLLDESQTSQVEVVVENLKNFQIVTRFD